MHWLCSLGQRKGTFLEKAFGFKQLCKSVMTLLPSLAEFSFLLFMPLFLWAQHFPLLLCSHWIMSLSMILKRQSQMPEIKQVFLDVHILWYVHIFFKAGTYCMFQSLQIFEIKLLWGCAKNNSDSKCATKLVPQPFF